MRHRTAFAFRGLALPAALTLLAAALAGCGASGPERPAPAAPTPGAAEPASRLPDIAFVDGPLALRVSYPRDSMRVATRGRNFIFGSAGNGGARVWIDGEEVEVQPNGGFLAFLPVPSDGVYHLRGALGDETATLEVPVLLPPPPPSPAEGPVIVEGSVYPAGGWVARPGERVEVGFRGTAGGRAWLVFGDGSRIPLPETVTANGGNARGS